MVTNLCPLGFHSGFHRFRNQTGLMHAHLRVVVEWMGKKSDLLLVFGNGFNFVCIVCPLFLLLWEHIF